MDYLCQFTLVHLGGRAIKTPEALTSVLLYNFIFLLNVIVAGKGTASERYITQQTFFLFFPLSSLVNLIKCKFYLSLNCGVGGSIYKNDLVLLWLMIHLELLIELS